MTEIQPTVSESVESEREVRREQHRAQTPIDGILEQLSHMELPAKEHFERHILGDILTGVTNFPFFAAAFFRSTNPFSSDFDPISSKKGGDGLGILDHLRHRV